MLKMLLSFVAGVGIGVAGSILYLEKKYQKKYNEQIEEMEEYYKKSDSYKRESYGSEGGEDEVVSVEERKNNKISKGSGARTVVQYDKMYDEEDEDSQVMSPEEEAHYDHLRNRDKPPELLSYEKTGELPEYYDHQVWYFYSYNEVMVSEDGEVIEDYERFLGDCLDKFDFIDNDEKLIFVVNYEYATLYEIQKVMAEYDG